MCELCYHFLSLPYQHNSLLASKAGFEILELSSKFVSGENGGNNQRSIEMPSDLDIRVDSFGKKK